MNKSLTSQSLSNSRGEGETITASAVAKHAQQNADRTPTWKQRAYSIPSGTLSGWSTKFRVEKHIKDRAKPRKIAKKPSDANEEHRVASPTRTIDSCGSQLVRLSPAERNILQYCTTIWMPTSYSSLPGDSHFTFTRFWPGDDRVALQVVQGAIQSPDAVSLYALLAASSQRMQHVSHIAIGKHVPEQYMLEAIRALRHRVASNESFLTQRLVLDLSWFVLYDLFNSTTKRAAVFWKMMQDVIIRLGGLQKLETFTALTAISCDYLKALANFEACAIDPYEIPQLVGINDQEWGTRPGNDGKVTAILEQLDPRVRLVAQEANAYDQMLRTIKELPPFALKQVSAAVTQEAMSVYNFPFVPVKRDKVLTLDEEVRAIAEQGGTDGELQEGELTVDTMPVLCRHKAVRVWAYFSVVTAAQKDVAHESEIIAAIQPRPPDSILNDLWFLSQNLKRLAPLLADIGWAMREDFLLWMSAVGLLASPTHHERLTFVEVFSKQAGAMDIKTKAEMDKLFSRQLPVHMIRKDALFILWELFATHDAQG